MKLIMKTRTTLSHHLAGLALALLATASPYVGAAPAAPAAAESASAPEGSASQPVLSDGSDYVAAWTVMSEICEDKFPKIKPLVEDFWTKRGNRETRDRVATIKSSPDFPARVTRLRKTLMARKDEVLAQCGQLFSGTAH